MEPLRWARWTAWRKEDTAWGRTGDRAQEGQRRRAPQGPSHREGALEPGQVRPVPSDDQPERRQRPGRPPQLLGAAEELPHGADENVDPLLADDARDPQDHHLFVLRAEHVPPPEGVALARVVQRRVHAAREEPHLLSLHPSLHELLRGGVRGNCDEVALVVEGADEELEERAHPGGAVVLGVAVKRRVVGARGAHAALLRPPDGGVAEEVRGGDVDDVGAEEVERGALLAEEPGAPAVVGAAGGRDGGDDDGAHVGHAAGARAAEGHVRGDQQHVRVVAVREEVPRDVLERAAHAVDVVPDGGDDGDAALRDHVPLGGDGAAAPQRRAHARAEPPVVALQPARQPVELRRRRLQAARAQPRGALPEVVRGAPVPLVVFHVERVGGLPREGVAPVPLQGAGVRRRPRSDERAPGGARAAPGEAAGRRPEEPVVDRHVGEAAVGGDRRGELLRENDDGAGDGRGAAPRVAGERELRAQGGGVRGLDLRRREARLVRGRDHLHPAPLWGEATGRGDRAPLSGVEAGAAGGASRGAVRRGGRASARQHGRVAEAVHLREVVGEGLVRLELRHTHRVAASLALRDAADRAFDFGCQREVGGRRRRQSVWGRHKAARLGARAATGQAGETEGGARLDVLVEVGDYHPVVGRRARQVVLPPLREDAAGVRGQGESDRSGSAATAEEACAVPASLRFHSGWAFSQGKAAA